MLLPALLLAAAATATPPPSDPNAPRLYKVELNGGDARWSIGKPQPNGPLVLFKSYPDGSLMSVRAKDVKRIVATAASQEAAKSIKPGAAIEIGATGGGIATSAAGGVAPPASKGGATPAGSRPDGSALFNPARAYNPTWDSKLVPGSTMGLPNSPNDYVEGKTIAHPPAPAVQAAPGDVPRAPE
jgi:hypothetical protein